MSARLLLLALTQNALALSKPALQLSRPVYHVRPIQMSAAGPAIGAAVTVAHALTKAPRMAKLYTSTTRVAMPASTWYGDFGIYAVRLAYHIRSSYPFSAWCDLTLLVMFHAAGVALVHRQLLPPAPGISNAGSGSKSAERPWVGITRSLCGCAVICWGLLQLPLTILRWLNLFTLPLLVASYTGQVLANSRSESTGGLTAGSVLRRWSRSVARVITTLVQLGGDSTLLAVHLLSTIGCSTLLMQLWWFRGSSETRAASNDAPTAVAAGVAAASAAPTSYDYMLAALMWRSLGGFEDDARRDQPPLKLSRKNLRAAFEHVDADGDGEISRDELADAILSSRPDVSEGILVKMLDEADNNRNGCVDFDEYVEIMELTFSSSGD